MTKLLSALLALVLSTAALAQRTDWFNFSNTFTNAVQTIKASPTPLLGYMCFNPNATIAYIQIFDATSGVTLGTTVPNRTIALPALNSTGLQAPSPPFSMSVGFQAAATTTQTGSTAPSTAVSCEFYYR